MVSSLATWMRAMAWFFYLGAGLLFVAAAITYNTRPLILPSIIAGFIIVIIVLGIAGTCLRSAASSFERGVTSGDEVPIGLGFQTLRTYLILFGIFSIFTFLLQAYRLLYR